MSTTLRLSGRGVVSIEAPMKNSTVTTSANM